MAEKKLPVKMQVGGASTSKTMESIAKQQLLSSVKQWVELFLEGQLKIALFLDNVKEDAAVYCRRTGRVEETKFLCLFDAEEEEGSESSSEGSSSEMEFQ